MLTVYLNQVYPRNYKVSFFIAVFLVIWIIIIKIVTDYVITQTNDRWEEIYSEKSKEQKKSVNQLFKKLRNDLVERSTSYSSNLTLKKSLENSEIRKINNFFVSNPDFPDYIDAELYDKRFDQIFFRGRQLNPEFLLLQKAFKGEAITVIRENGFFTYLVHYRPVRGFTDEISVSGVLVTGILLTDNYPRSAEDIFNPAIGEDIKGKLHSELKIIPERRLLYASPDDTGGSLENLSLLSEDGSEIGKAVFTKYNITLHNQNIENLSDKVTSVLYFLLTLFAFPLAFRVSNLFRSVLVRIFLTLILLAIVRYLWIFSNFPYSLISYDVFQTQYYASMFGFGIAKSLGDLLITSIFVLLISIYSVRIVYERISLYNSQNSKIKLPAALASLLLQMGGFFVLMHIFGTVLNALIFNSNIKYLDKANIIPDAPLFMIQIIIIIITFSFVVFSSCIILSAMSYSRELFKINFYRKFYILILAAVFLIVNQVFVFTGITFNMEILQRLAAIITVFILCYYIFGSVTSHGNSNLFSLRNLSFLFLISIFLTPLILLEKTKSKEASYIEQIGNELIENQDDKIIYLLSNELTEISQNKDIESFMKDPGKSSRISYYLWKGSIFNDLNYRTDIIVLDTALNVISDYNAGSGLLVSDSIVSFMNGNFFRRKLEFFTPDSDSVFFGEEENEDVNEEIGTDIEVFVFEGISIINNRESNYLTGIVPLEKIELKNTQFAENIGYVMISVNTESINLLTSGIFRSAPGRLKSETALDRLITKPVITEFKNGEVYNSTEPEVSENLFSPLEAFREYMKGSGKKEYWRYDEINNEKYRSYFITSSLAGYDIDDNGTNGRTSVFAVSIKRDDFSLIAFYFLKFVLFALSVYVVFYLVSSLVYLLKVRRIRFNFREKVFLTFVIVSVIPIVILAVYTRSYINSKNEQNIRNRIVSDLNLVNESLKEEKILFNKFVPLDSVYNAARNILTRNFSGIGKNYNLFLKNKLIATTDEELFKSDFLDTRIDRDGYYNIYLMKKDLHLKMHYAGNLSYLTGYKPLKDRANTIYGIITSLSVYKQREINEELTETLTFIFGSYFIVIMILMFIVTYVSGKISKPILILQKATEKIASGETNVVINIDRGDELGSLVDAFNKMSRDLEKSRARLKKAEREAAWRDIARRVAHEIKNPLTPMKLSIQHLYNIYGENDPENFEAVLKKTRNLISKEIDKLNRIATAFSDFAKLPGRNYEKLNLNEILEDVISLYELDKRVEFRKNLSPSLSEVRADRQEMNRVFQNLIKNAVQSIEYDGIIEIKSFNMNFEVIVEINDNGIGIDSEMLPKLFEPNFSTKSRGMGLGLAIVRKSLDDMKASLSFESKQGEGTKVTVKFKAMNE